MSAHMTKRIYAVAAAMNMVERNNKDDAFHQLVSGITGKTSVKELTSAEAIAVEQELMKRMKLESSSKPQQRKVQKKSEPGMMTTDQQHLAWRLMYRLAEIEPTKATVGERIVGAIQKELHITATIRKPFMWVDFDGGTKLIEQLKRYVRSAERRAAKKAGEK